MVSCIALGLEADNTSTNSITVAAGLKDNVSIAMLETYPVMNCRQIVFQGPNNVYTMQKWVGLFFAKQKLKNFVPKSNF